jgi:hypothetical protein
MGRVASPRFLLAVGLGLAALATLPAAAASAPPGNDPRAAATPLSASKSATSASTVDATRADTDPAEACGNDLGSTVWYRLTDVPTRTTVLRLSARPPLDAVLAVYRLHDERLTQVDCDETGDPGAATVGFQAREGDLVLVAQTADSAPGSFVLRALVPQPTEHPPGRALHRVGTGILEQYLNQDDLWHTGLRPGATYTMSLVVRGDGCPRVTVYRASGRNRASPAAEIRCDRAVSFTPGPDGGGRYLFAAHLSYASGRVPYRLQVVRAQRDDTAPGLPLAAGTWQEGRLSPSNADPLDMYRFVLPRRSDVLLALHRPRPRNVSLLLVREDGKRLAAGQAIRRSVPRGTYFVVVSAPVGSPAANYRLALRTHEVSRLVANDVRVLQAPLGTAVLFGATIGAPAGRTAALQIDRFDPLEGWLFVRRFSLPVSPDATISLTWHPPQLGQFRARITAPSRSSYVLIEIVDPLG